MDDIRDAQAEELGDVRAMAASDKRMLVDEDGLLRIAKDGDLAVVVPRCLRTKVLEHVHGSASRGTTGRGERLLVCGEDFGGKVG